MLRCLCCCCLVTKSCLTLCDPMDCCWPGSPVRGISQARILEWVALSFSRGSSWPRNWTCIGRRILYHSASRDALEVLLLGQNFFFFQFLAFDSWKQQEKQIRFACFLPRVLCSLKCQSRAPVSAQFQDSLESSCYCNHIKQIPWQTTN